MNGLLQNCTLMEDQVPTPIEKKTQKEFKDHMSWMLTSSRRVPSIVNWSLGKNSKHLMQPVTSSTCLPPKPSVSHPSQVKIPAGVLSQFQIQKVSNGLKLADQLDYNWKKQVATPSPGHYSSD